MMANRVEGKIAVVTGGAAGMGRAHSLLLAQQGASVVVTDVDGSGGKETVQMIEAAGGTASFVQHDVSSAADWAAVVDHAVERHG
ncbi:MAG: cyclopentanol dehydrogenase, partial [Arthrobacter sp.]|nr:cyclopentanol dehydrogenase [Arthrobacter sp.]